MPRKNIVAKRALDKLQIGREKFSACLCRTSEDSYKQRGKMMMDSITERKLPLPTLL
jgi:hypothetical protein